MCRKGMDRREGWLKFSAFEFSSAGKPQAGGLEYGSDGTGNEENESQDYGSEYQTRLDVKVVKKDGTRESFNVQKVVNAVGKSAYRALTKFTDEEKRKYAAM